MTPPETWTREMRVPTLFIDPLARIFLGVLLFLALLFGRSDLAVFCLAVLLLSTGAKLWRRAAAPRVSARFLVGTLRASPGEPLVFTLEVGNGSILPVAVRSRLDGLERLSGEGRVEGGQFCRVRGGRGVRLHWTVEAPGRGVYPVGPHRTEAGDPFGLFFRQVAHGQPLEVLVYPRRFPVGPTLGQARDLFGCIRAEGLIEDPVNLMGTREYQPGRPARAIHWKASVRLNRLQEKVFEPSRRARILLSLDVRGFHEAGDEPAFEEALEAAASIAVHLVRGGASVGLLTNAAMQGPAPPVVPVSQAPEQLSVILERMARMTLAPAGDLTGPAGRLLARTPGAGCLHFVYTVDAAAEAFGASLADRKAPVSFVAVRRSEDPSAGPAAGREVVYVETLRGSGGAS